MAENNAQLVVEIKLDDGTIQKGFISLQNTAKKTSENMEDEFSKSQKSISSGFKSLGLAVAGYLGFSAIKSGLNSVVAAGIEVENAANSLKSAFALTGQEANSAFMAFKNYADGLERATGISSELIQKNSALLVNLGRLSGEGLERATKASLDLAQALQIDPGTAFNLVAKAAEGNVAALGRYGIKVDESLSKSQKFAAVLAQLEERFGGLAASRLNTLEGALDNLSNAFGDISEAIGGLFTQSPVLRAVLNFVADSFRKLADSIEQFGKKGDVVGDLIIKFLDFAKVVAGSVAGAFEFLYKGVVAVFQLMVSGVELALTGFAKLAQGASFLLNSLGAMSDETYAKVKMFADASAAATADSVAQTVETMRSAFTLETPAIVDTYVSEMGRAASAARGLGTATTEMKNEVALNNEEVGTSFEYLMARIGDSIRESTGSLKTLGKEIGGTFKNGVVGALSAVGAAFANGENAFNAFGKSLLRMLGQIAVQVGTFLLFAGLGFAALPFGFSGAGAIAAGTALIILGGAIQALAGASTDSVASNPSGATSGSSGGGGIASTPESGGGDLNRQAALEDPGTSVQVVIQGDVLDSDASGSRIVDLINQAFDKKGVVIQRGVIA